MNRTPKKTSLIYQKEQTNDGCLPLTIFLIVTILCPPIGIALFFIYFLYKAPSKISEPIVYTISVILILILLIISPIITVASICENGFADTLQDESIVSFITLCEIILTIIIICKVKFKCKLKPVNVKIYIPILIISCIATIYSLHELVYNNPLFSKYGLFVACCTFTVALYSLAKITFYELQKDDTTQENFCMTEPKTQQPCQEQLPQQQSESDNAVLTDTNNNVFITASGKKYHQKSCKCIQNKTNIIEISLDEANSHGYVACGMCSDTKYTDIK